jgi:hypothetical protein
METETWKTIPDYDGYEASNFGRIRSWWKTGCKGQKRKSNPIILKPHLNTSNRRGRYIVHLAQKGRIVGRNVAHLVLFAFTGPRPLGLECCHKDDNREHNGISNLRWDTKQGNWNDRRRNGNGTGHHVGSPSARLTEDQVLLIRNGFAVGLHRRALALQYQVCERTISDILSGHTWPHVGGPLNNHIGRPPMPVTH